MPKSKTAQTLDIAARHLVYKLFDRTEGVSGAWHALTDIEERPATVARAVERGWVLTREIEMVETLIGEVEMDETLTDEVGMEEMRVGEGEVEEELTSEVEMEEKLVSAMLTSEGRLVARRGR
jgi:hypothetical protein